MKTRDLGPSTALLMGVVSASALWGAAGCTGMIGRQRWHGHGGRNGRELRRRSGSGGTSIAGTGATGAEPPALLQIDITQVTMPESAGPMVMRRLTYREYDHMMTQLLGDTTSPASGASGWTADDAGRDRFRRARPKDVASYHVIQYNQTASTLVDNAIKALSAGQKTGKFVLPTGCTAPTAAQESSCATKFITSFGLAAFRRPVSAQEQTDLMAAVFDGAHHGSLQLHRFHRCARQGDAAVAQLPLSLGDRTDEAAAGSDGLLPLTPWQVASRLASAIWESMPDDTLLSAAQNGQLSTASPGGRSGLERMLADPQAAQSLYNFHLQWFFNMGFHVTDLASVDAKANSPLTDAAASGLQTEFTQFITSVYAPPGDGTLKTLYTAPYAFVNKDLAAIYGVTGPETGFAKVALDPSQRAGIFTQVSFLAGIEDTVADNPVYRGLAIYTKALCGAIPPPPMMPPAVNFTSAATTRKAFDAHGKLGLRQGLPCACSIRPDSPSRTTTAPAVTGRRRTMSRSTRRVPSQARPRSPVRPARRSSSTMRSSS